MIVVPTQLLHGPSHHHGYNHHSLIWILQVTQLAFPQRWQQTNDCCTNPAFMWTVSSPWLPTPLSDLDTPGYTACCSCKLQWYAHVSRSSGIAKTILHGTVKGGRRQRKRWKGNIKEWTGLEFAKSQRAVENRENWKKWLWKKKNDDPRSKGIVNDELPVYNSDLVTCVQ